MTYSYIAERLICEDKKFLSAKVIDGILKEIVEKDVFDSYNEAFIDPWFRIFRDLGMDFREAKLHNRYIIDRQYSKLSLELLYKLILAFKMDYTNLKYVSSKDNKSIASSIAVLYANIKQPKLKGVSNESVLKEPQPLSANQADTLQKNLLLCSAALHTNMRVMVHLLGISDEAIIAAKGITPFSALNLTEQHLHNISQFIRFQRCNLSNWIQPYYTGVDIRPTSQYQSKSLEVKRKLRTSERFVQLCEHLGNDLTVHPWLIAKKLGCSSKIRWELYKFRYIPVTLSEISRIAELSGLPYEYCDNMLKSFYKPSLYNICAKILKNDRDELEY